MQICSSKTEGLKKSYHIKVSAQEIIENNQSKVAEIKHQANLAGFRPGKVPANYLLKRFKTAITGETIDKLIREMSLKIIKDEGLELISEPNINVTKEYKDGEDLEYEFSCEVFPEIKEIDFKKIKLTKYVVRLSSALVEKECEAAIESKKTFKIIEDKNATAKRGGGIKIDYSGSINGEKFEGGEAKDFDVEIGSRTLIDTFEQQLVGLKKGDHKTIKVKFPKDYHAQDLQGKNAEFVIDVKEILEVSKPKLDDEFAKTQGAKDIAEYKANIQKALENHFNKLTKQQLKKELFDYFDDKVNFELPESLTDKEFKALIQRYVTENGYKDEQEAEDKNPKDFKKSKKEYLSIAKRRIKIGILISDLGKKNEISVSDNEVLNHLREEIAKYPGDQEQLLQLYQSNRQLIENMRGTLIEDKIVDFILSKITTKDKDVTSEQFEKIYSSQ